MKYQTPCNATAMRMSSRRWTALYDSAPETIGPRSSQYAILALLNRLSNDPPTLSGLADMLVMDCSALDHNPLTRTRRVYRAVHVVLTKVSMARFEEAERVWKKAQDQFNAVYGANEAISLRSILARYRL